MADVGAPGTQQRVDYYEGNLKLNQLQRKEERGGDCLYSQPCLEGGHVDLT